MATDGTDVDSARAAFNEAGNLAALAILDAVVTPEILAKLRSNSSKLEPHDRALGAFLLPLLRGVWTTKHLSETRLRAGINGSWDSVSRAAQFVCHAKRLVVKKKPNPGVPGPRLERALNRALVRIIFPDINRHFTDICCRVADVVPEASAVHCPEIVRFNGEPSSCYAALVLRWFRKIVHEIQFVCDRSALIDNVTGAADANPRLRSRSLIQNGDMLSHFSRDWPDWDSTELSVCLWQEFLAISQRRAEPLQGTPPGPSFVKTLFGERTKDAMTLIATFAAMAMEHSVESDHVNTPEQNHLERNPCTEFESDSVGKDVRLQEPRRAPGSVADPITLEQAALLLLIDVKTIQNRGTKTRPCPVRKRRGRSAAIFSYQTIRPWLLENFPQVTRDDLPEDYAAAMRLLSARPT